MKVYKLKDFAREARRCRISDEDLSSAVGRAERGLIDAEIGRFLIKQRVARPNEGRSGGFRVIIVHEKGRRALFLYVFPKSKKANLTPHEEETFRAAAKQLAALDEEVVRKLAAAGEWIEIEYEP